MRIYGAPWRAAIAEPDWVWTMTKFWPKYQWMRLMRVTVCRWTGHVQNGNAFRLLGLCGRCYEPLPHEAP